MPNAVETAQIAKGQPIIAPILGAKVAQIPRNLASLVAFLLLNSP
jgi:hypothetical protein